MADTHPVADSQTYSSADLYAVAHVYPMADTDSYPSTDLHTVPNFHPVADTEGRADLHAIPYLYTLAYIDTDTCAY